MRCDECDVKYLGSDRSVEYTDFVYIQIIWGRATMSFPYICQDIVKAYVAVVSH